MKKRPWIILAEPAYSAPALNGLFPLSGRVVAPSAEQPQLAIRVGLAGQSAVFELPAEDFRPRGRRGWYGDFSLVLNTFLVGPGEHDLTLEIVDSPGSPLRHRVFVSNDTTLGKRTAEAISQHKDQRWIWRDGEIDSRHFPVDDPAVKPWFDQADALAQASSIAARAQLDAPLTDALSSFVRDGYCVLPFRADEHLLAALNQDLDAMERRGQTETASGTDHRLEQMHQKSRAARALWRDPRVLSFLNTVFQQRAIPCQTLVFLKGSEQAIHQDTIHLTPFPAGYMCGVWIALEDIRPESGPLTVSPGSHRAPRFYAATVGMEKVREFDWADYEQKFLPRLAETLEQSGFPEQTYLPRKGDILVWHENLAHGGSVAQIPGLSRRSMVSHYFSEGSAFWYDTTGFASGVQDTAGAPRRSQLRSRLRKTNALVRGRLAAAIRRRLGRNSSDTVRVP